MHYTAPEVLLFIAAIGVLLQNTISAWRNGTKIDQTLTKASIIEGHVNSKETKYVEQISSYQREVQTLKETIAEKNKIAEMLAQSVAQAKPSITLPEINKTL